MRLRSRFTKGRVVADQTDIGAPLGPAGGAAGMRGRLVDENERLTSENVRLEQHGKDGVDLAQRYRELVGAGIAISSEVDLDRVLRTSVEAAARITGARYGALGVLDAQRLSLERFITTGVSEAEQAAIGDLPRGRGLLGALIHTREPIRLARMHDDPRSIGFPPGHPPMETFLGVPIFLRGVVFGNLYLCDRVDGEPFSDDDEAVTRLLALQVATAIENARLLKASSRWAVQVESLNEIQTALFSEQDLDGLLRLIAQRLSEVVHAGLVTVELIEGESLRVAAAVGEHAEVARGHRVALPLGFSRVIQRRRAERVDSLIDDVSFDQVYARAIEATSGIFVPLIVDREPVGLLCGYDNHPAEGVADTRFSDDDLRLADAFADRAAAAIDLSRRVSRESVRSIVAGEERERMRLSRELHDETGQALASILLALRRLEKAAGEEAVAPVRELVHHTLDGVRRLAVDLRPSVLDDIGLEPALQSLVERLRVPDGPELALTMHSDRLDLTSEIETVLYRTAQEALTNAIKHAEAHLLHVELTRGESDVHLRISDDGHGFDPAQLSDRLGLRGMRERVALLGGQLLVSSGAETGTVVEARIPVPQVR